MCRRSKAAWSRARASAPSPPQAAAAAATSSLREGVLVETVDVTDVDGDRLDDVVAVAQGQEIGRQVVVNGAPACRSR